MQIRPGACVIVSLQEPKEKFWGLLEEINAAGVFLRGIDLSSFDELLSMLSRGDEGIYPASMFFPLRRLERILLDESAGNIQSLAQHFEQRTGLQVTEFLGVRNYGLEIHSLGE